MWNVYFQKYSVCVLCIFMMIECVLCNRADPVYNLEHWEAIHHYQDGSGYGRVVGVVAFHNKQCDLSGFRHLERNVPDRRHILLGTYDVSVTDLAWYNISQGFYNLAERYNVVVDKDHCPQVLLFPAGHRSRLPIPYESSSHTSLHQFVWSHLRLTRVPIINGLDVPVKVLWHSNPLSGDGQLAHEVEARNEEPQFINTFVSHIFSVVTATTNKFVCAFEVSTHTTYFLEYGESKSMDDWRDDYKRRKHEDTHFIDQMVWSHTRRHIFMLKIPPSLPRFSKTSGILKIQQPPEVFKILRDHWEAQKNDPSAGEIEKWPRGATQVNFHVVQTRMFHLPWEKKYEIGRILQPILEDWCDCPLKFDTMYGIRAYYPGSLLEKHVDRIGTHVVSAILNVVEDLDEDWVIEVVDAEGNTQFIPQHPGELVLYESSVVPHGRPKPLRGRIYASAFLHYTPANDWGFAIAGGNNDIVTPSGRTPLEPIENMPPKFEGPNRWQRSYTTSDDK